MNLLLFELLSLAGGIGAACRLLLDGLLRAHLTARFPVETAVINVTGSLLLGLITGLATGQLPEAAAALLGSGFLGGYTTFSTASIEPVRLLQDRRVAAALIAGIGTLVLSTTVAAGGYLLGRAGKSSAACRSICHRRRAVTPKTRASRGNTSKADPLRCSTGGRVPG